MKKIHASTIILATALAACGNAEMDSASGVPPLKVITPPTGNTETLSARSQSSGPTGTLGIGNGGSNPVFILNGSSDGSLTRLSNASAHNGQLTAYRQSNGTDRMVIFAESNGARVSVAGNSGFSSQALVAGRTERLTGSEVPVDGTVRYTGDYSSVFVQNENGSAQALTGMIQGDARVDVNFSADQVEGAITNRTFHGASGSRISTHNPGDVTLSQTNLTGTGAFSGTASGGVFSRNSSVNGGAFDGIVAGAQGDTAIGTVRIDHVLPPKGGDSNHASTSSSFIEMGAFHTKKH